MCFFLCCIYAIKIIAISVRCFAFKQNVLSVLKVCDSKIDCCEVVSIDNYGLKHVFDSAKTIGKCYSVTQWGADLMLCSFLLSSAYN